MRLILTRLLFIVTMLSLSGLPSFVHAETSPTLEQQVSALTALVVHLETKKAANKGVSLSRAEMQTIIDDSISWLSVAQEENGHFRYEYAPYEDRYLADDNIVRQAGALYQLGEALRQEESAEEIDKESVDDNADEIASTMAHAIGYFASLSGEGTHTGKSFLCIIEKENSTRCKLGATALALVGILSFVQSNQYHNYYHNYDDLDYHGLVASYFAYIEAMRKENGGFRNTFDLSGGAQSFAESSFSNGEALLALVRYHDYRPNKTFQKSARETFDYLKTTPFDTALYLWMMAALDHMYAWEPHAEYEAYVRAYTDWRLESVAHLRQTGHNMCAYTEGVALAYGILDTFLPEAALAAYRREIDFWLKKGSVLQVTKNDRYRVTIEEGVPSFWSIADMGRAYGGFLTGESVLTQRIDFTQHCLSAYLVWNNIKK